MKYHPLTEKLRLTGYARTETIDHLIRTELEKMAKEITQNNYGHLTYPQFVRKTLGLSEVSEPDPRVPHSTMGGCHPECPETPKSEKWCDHMKKPQDDDFWKFCPICGTPRPKSKTLEEKVAEAILKEGMRLNWFPRDGEKHLVAKSASDNMAQAAIQAVREHDKGEMQ